MKPYTLAYMRFFDYGEEDFIPCEWCGAKSVDIHHIYGRGKLTNEITNLIALCRDCHTDAHNEKITKEQLKQKHETIIRD